VGAGGWLIFVRLTIEIWELDKVALEGEVEVGWVSGASNVGAAGFCGPCVCLGVFLLL
jgi:hypothetical protein